MPRVVLPQAGRSLRCALILGALAAGPALAQTPSAPATGRSISPAGRTMPPPRGVPPAAAPTRTQNEAAMIKAQKAAEDRSKAWDSKMHKTMGTICNGC